MSKPTTVAPKGACQHCGKEVARRPSQTEHFGGQAISYSSYKLYPHHCPHGEKCVPLGRFTGGSAGKPSCRKCRKALESST